MEQAARILAQVGQCGRFGGLGPWPTRLELAAAEGAHPDTIARRCARWGVPTRVVVTQRHRCRVEVDLGAYQAAVEREGER